MLTRIISTFLAALALVSVAAAHKGHHHVSPGDATNAAKPIDALLWVHVATQVGVWGVLFPVGMVLGLGRSRWHVPVQSTGMLLTGFLGYISGQRHGGRAFPKTVHSTFASLLIPYLLLQLALGIFLKLHVLERTTLRAWAVRVHKWLGVTFPVVGWVQCVFGAATLGGYCMGGGLGQCLAHYIMGSAFIAYGAIYALMLHLGGAWLARRGQSQEFFDSGVITVWGIVNTFTEHHGGPWTPKDLQHTLMGVLWWAGGALGLFLSRKNRRSLVPAGIIIMTGFAMSSHAQAMEISTKIHAIFGYALMAAGLSRIIEISFVLRDAPTPTSNGRGEVKAFQHLPPYLLVLSGTMFMGATDEELKFVSGAGVDHVTYAMILFSLSFLIYLHISLLLSLYSHLSSLSSSRSPSTFPADAEEGYERVPLTATTPASRDGAGMGMRGGGGEGEGTGSSEGTVFELGDEESDEEGEEGKEARGERGRG